MSETEPYQPSTARRNELYHQLIALQKQMSGGADFAAALHMEQEYERLKAEFDLYYDDEPGDFDHE